MKVYSPLKGKHVALSEVSDPVFAQKMMGEGSAIIPSDNLVVAPVNGTLTTVFPTKHALGFKTADGLEVLIHIGINTVELNGEHFELHVEQGQEVVVGDPLVTVDFDKVKAAGYDIVTPVIVLNTADYESVTDIADGDLEILSELIEIK